MTRRKQSVRVRDIGLPKRYDIKKHGITQSLLKAFPTCRQRFLFMVNGWRPNDDGLVFLFGNLCHYIMEKVYAKKIKPSKILLGKYIKNYRKEFKDEISKILISDLERMSGLARIVMFHYFKYYPKDFRKKYTSIEGEFNVKLGPYTLLGKRDLRYKIKGGEVMQEHKTKSRVEEDLLMHTLSFDFQNLFYITAQTLEDKVKISWVLYNIIRNPNIKQLKSETFKQYLERVEQDIINRPDFYFIRYEVPYSEPDKKQFKKELVIKLIEAQKFLNGELPLYRNQDACKTPYRCPYLGACSTGRMAGYKQTDNLFPELDTTSFNPKK